MGRSWRAFAFAGLLASVIPAQGPSEAGVRALFDRADRAIAAPNVDAPASMLSDGVQISGALPAANMLLDRCRLDTST